MFQHIFVRQVQFNQKQNLPVMLTVLLSVVIFVQILSFTSFVVGNGSLTHT